MLTMRANGYRCLVQVASSNTADRGVPDESLSVCHCGEVRLPPRATSRMWEVVCL